MDTLLTQHHILRRLAFPTTLQFPLVINQVIMPMGMWADALLCSTSLFELVQYHIEFMTMALSLVLIFGTANNFFLPQDFIGHSWPLHFHINFRIFNRKKQDFHWCCIESIDALREMNIFIRFLSAKFCTFQYKGFVHLS